MLTNYDSNKISNDILKIKNKKIKNKPELKAKHPRIEDKYHLSVKTLNLAANVHVDDQKFRIKKVVPPVQKNRGLLRDLKLAKFKIQSLVNDSDNTLRSRIYKLLPQADFAPYFWQGIKYKFKFRSHFEVEDFIVKLYEDVLFYVIDLMESFSIKHIYQATMRFIKYRYGRVCCEATFQDLANKFVKFYRMILDVVPQNETPFTCLRSLLCKFEEVRNAPIFKKLYKFIMYVLCTSVLEKFGASKKFCEKLFEKLHLDATVKRKFHFGIDFFHCMFDTIVYVCEIGYQCFMLGSLEPLFHSGTKYSEWFDKVYELKRKSLLTANCEAHGFTMFEFLHDIDDVIEKGESISKHAVHVGDFEKNSIRALLNDIKMIKDTELTKKHAAQSRQAPFSVLLHGGSSVGKSSFTDVLFCMYAKVHNMPVGEEYIYTRNPNDEYWSTFRTSQWGIKLDDIGFLRPEKATTGDPSLLEMIQVVNNVPFTPAQADLADKGKTPVKARFVVATSNAKDLNAFHYFSCSLAVRRRLPWVITISPKHEYAKDDAPHMIDPSKLPVLPEGEFPNFWNIEIQKVIPIGDSLDRQQADLKKIATFNNINLFLQWFADTSLEFDKLQKLALSVNEKIEKVILCNTCYLSENLCKCVIIDGNKMRIAPQANELVPYQEPIWVKETTNRVILNNTPESIESVFMSTLSYFTNFHLFCYFYIDTAKVFILWSILLYINIFWFKTPLTCLICGMLTYFSRPICNTIYGRSRMVLYIVSKSSTPIGKYLWRRVLHKAGGIMESKFSQAILASCAMITAVAFISTVSSMFSKNPHLNSQSSEDIKSQDINPGQSPKDKDEETFNPWIKESYTLTSFDVSETTSSYKGLGAEKVLNMLKSNCVYFCIRGFKSQRAFCVGGHFYLVNSHGIPDGDFSLSIIENFDSDGVTANLKDILVTPNMVSRIPEKDLAIVYVRNVPPRKDFRELFCKSSLKGRWKGCYIGRNKTGSLTQMKVDNILFESQVSNEYLCTRVDSWVGNVAVDTVDGDCGYLLVTMTPLGPVLLGIHYLGGMESKLAISVKVTNDDISLLIRKFKTVIVQSAIPQLSAIGAPRSLGPLHKKSVFRYLEDGSARVYGSFEGFRPSLSSAVGPTIMNAALKRRGLVEHYGAPVVSDYRPWRVAALDLTNPVTNMRQDILDNCVEHFTKDILTNLSKSELEKVLIYDYFTSINGAAGVKFVDKLNRNTSMGCPWKKCKKHFLHPLPPVGEILDPVEFNDDIMDRVKRIESQYRRGYRVCPVFCGNLKDEATSFAKIESAKTRVFCGAPVDWSIVVRKYLLSFIRVVQRNTFIFESAPGTIPQSLQWERIYRYLGQHGVDRCVAGDYKAFDKRMGAILILAAFQIIINVCEAAGFSETDLLVVRCISEDTAFSFVDFNGDLVEFFGSNPSGHPLTVIINGLVNSLYMRYCYSILSPEGNSKSFKKHINLITYGDDNAMGVSKDISFFDHTKIVDVLASIGVVYTMADKESESVPFVNVNDITFLKRRFVFDDDIGAIVAPLEEDSIIKSLMTCVVSKSESLEHQCIDIIGAAIREYFNYGKIIFNAKSEMLKEIINECDLQIYVKNSTFPSFEDLKDEFWRASKSINVNKLRAQSNKICHRCNNEDCLHKNNYMDDYFLICTSCQYCVNFEINKYCPNCNCSRYGMY
nr:MAG: polyprotein 1 [Picornavirales sp.]